MNTNTSDSCFLCPKGLTKDLQMEELNSELTQVMINIRALGPGVSILVCPKSHVPTLGELTLEEYNDYSQKVREVSLYLDALDFQYNIVTNKGKDAGQSNQEHVHTHFYIVYMGVNEKRQGIEIKRTEELKHVSKEAVDNFKNLLASVK